MHPLPATDRQTVGVLSADPFLEHVTRKIVEQIGPRRIVLFGSRARGDARAESDYDIMVELETNLPPDEAEDLIYDLLPDQEGRIEICVYTPEEVRRWQDDVGTILYDVVREGRVLYSRPDVIEGDPAGLTLSPTRVSERQPGRLESPSSWMRSALHDFDAMQAAESWDPPPWDAVCFHAHQSCEKLFKACLIARSIRPPRTHDLPELLRRCRHAGFDFQHLRGSCRALQRLYPRSRYPRGRELTGRDATSAVAAATVIRKAALSVLGG